MYDFECHFRNEQWQTEQYFDYVKDLLKAAEDNISDDCDPPPCPTSLPTGKGFNVISTCCVFARSKFIQVRNVRQLVNESICKLKKRLLAYLLIII